MVKQIVQSTFAPAPFGAGSFNVHTRPEGRAATLCVFVHGLGGKGYETWGELPGRLFRESEGIKADIGIFDYRSGVRARFRGVDFGHLMRQLHGHLSQLESEYEDVFLIGHSLGGLVIEDVAKHYLQARAHAGTPDAGVLAGLVFVASPRAGSGWAVPFLSALSSEARALRRFARRSADVDQYFNTFVERRNVVSAPDGLVSLPAFAVTGSLDWLVSRFSATFGIPEAQCKFLTASHRSIKIPPSDDQELYDWLRWDVISTRIEIRAQQRREQAHSRSHAPRRNAADAVLTTQLLTDPSGMHWEEIYNEVRRGASTETVSVRDVRDAASSQTDLLIAVHDSQLVLKASPGVRTNVMEARAERVRERAKSVGICPVGIDFKAAESLIHEWLGELPWLPSLYIEGAPDADGFRQVLARLLALTIGRDPGRVTHPTGVDGTISAAGGVLDEW